MADAAPSTERRGGFGRRDGAPQGDRRGPRRGKDDKKGPKKPRGDEEKEWVPVTKLGRLVKDRKITNLHDIYYHALPIKEYQIVDKLFPAETLKDEVVKITPVQKQTAAGQRTKFKAYVIIGDKAGHIGLGTKVSKEVATAIRGAIIDAKLNIIPVRRGYWGNKVGAPHTVPMKVTGKAGSITCRLIPAPRGTGLVAAPTPKKLLHLAGIEDVFCNTRGCTKTQGNFITACYLALSKTTAYLTPDLWKITPFAMAPFQEFTDFLSGKAK